MAQHSEAIRTVELDELDERTRILAYSGFSEKYQPMDEKVCEWVKLNFKGAIAVVRREEERIELPVSELRRGDALLQIQKFPKSLKRLTIVNPKLVEELKTREFSKFKVTKLSKAESSSQANHKQAVEKADKLIQQVKENIEVRDVTTQTVEKMMDDSRKGKVDTREILTQVEGIVNSASSDAMTAIASLKQSDQTYAHCVDVGAIFMASYQRILDKRRKKSTFDSEQEILLGSFLHDFGKAKIPKDIIDSTTRFEKDSQEMRLIRQHPTFGAELLSGMNMSNTIINMAHYHHVKIDNTIFSSYPEGVEFKTLTLEARLIAIIDIYQALVGKRSYKKSWAPPAAMRFIDQLAGVEYDPEVWQSFLEVMGLYPKGSLVELTDKSQGFVVNVPTADLSRPQVVLVRNSAGEDLEHQSLIDLEVERELSIEKELDSYETFGENVIEVFSNLQII